MDDFVKDTNVPINDRISRHAAIDVVHHAIYDFFDICEDDDESPITYKDEKLLEVNKEITRRISELQSVERKKGNWIGIDDEPCETFECDVCGFVLDDWIQGALYRYCPNCGAWMGGEQG